MADLLDLALAEQGRGRQLAQVRDEGLAHLQIQGQGQADSLFQARFRITGRAAPFPVRMDDDGALNGRFAINEFGGTQSVSSSPGS